MFSFSLFLSLTMGSFTHRQQAVFSVSFPSFSAVSSLLRQLALKARENSTSHRSPYIKRSQTS
ncbi:hypothetical protein CSUI_000808, partial [Cystoisospora suis]